ncbi:translocation/assembly module TamB [Entomomonas sp. E2T0]|uniref:translocation/assembly module TamB domain-containing protein n=1 Tax=Entomomonas sp. E2T0 TaxID=2930213 RepID=UPI002228507D|nr:translocation/assembly module TamB domain-containing protein [Entomomonas sp. E2T0]UYZ83727.1 translocation/assembly module TamB [Entomomonas sp. E2T0]
MKLTRKIAKYFFIILLILILLLIAALSFAVKTETGSRYLLNIVPGLTITNPQGTLSGGWSAEQLVWQNDGIKVTINHPILDWYASCLVKANVCIDKLSVEQLNIKLLDNKDTASNESASDEPIQLPTIHLPVSIDIKTIQLDKLILDNQEIISQTLLTNTHWSNASVSFESLTLYSAQAKANIALQGNIQLADNWPLNIAGQLQLDQLLETPWQIKLNAQGELQKQLNLAIESSGYLQAKINGSAHVLEKDLPADITVNINDFFPSNVADLPKSLTIKQLNLNAKGDLAKGFSITSHATLAGQTTPVNVTLQSLVTDKQAELQTLTLNTTEQQFVKITGQANFQPSLQAKATIDYQHFPWQQLYPLESSPPVDLSTLLANLQYQNNNYQADIKAALTGPAGNFAVTSKLLGDLKQITLETLQVDTPDNGNITGKAKVTFDPTITWLADLNLKAINPNYWVPDLIGLLNGNIHSTGTIVNSAIETDSKIDITGTLRNQPTQIKTQVLAKQQIWKIPELLVKVGNNQITGHAELNKNIQANLDINMPSLNQLLPELAGNLRGKAQLAGSLQQPQGSVNLTGQKLAYQQQRINQLQLTANLNAQQQATVKLQANHIRSGTTQLGNLIIEGNGNINNQQLTLQLTDGLVKLITAIKSQQDKQHNWIVDINKLQLASQGQDWQLQSPTKLHYSAVGALTLDSHCLQNGQATLCAIEQQKLLPETQINYKLANFPLDSLKPWYPENFNWKGILAANIVLKLPQSGPTGKIEINANSGTFQLRENSEESWHDLPYQKLSLLADLTPSKITSHLDFIGGNLGSLKSQLTINPLAANKPIAGDFSINGLDISIFQPFAPDINQLEGKINGQGKITGFLEKPYVSGKVTLNNGTVLGDIPVSLEQLQVNALIEGESLKLDGSWRSGQQGNAKLNGNVNWGNGLNINMAVQANNLPVIVAPYANLEAGANLKLQMDTETLNVSGTVQIPRGAIKVRDLPPSTVTISSDAVIVSSTQSTETKAPIRLNMDVEVLIGSDRLSFQGFGLTSNITGNLKITRDLFTQGSVNLNDGIYRAYGQRLKISKARILFTGSLTEPTLDIEAIREVGDVTAGIRVTGPTSEPTAKVFSNPPMNQDQALSYIIFGRPMSSGDNNVLAQAALAMGVAGSSESVANVASKVGIQDFQLDTEGSGDDTSITASGKITEDLSIHYGVNIFNSLNTLMFRYKLTKTVYLEAASGAASSLDIFYKKSFK